MILMITAIPLRKYGLMTDGPRDADRVENTILNIDFKRVFLIRKSTVVVFFLPMFLGICLPECKKKLLNLGLFAKYFKKEVDSINENEIFSNDRVQF